jgi:hypothetical protein
MRWKTENIYSSGSREGRMHEPEEREKISDKGEKIHLPEDKQNSSDGRDREIFRQRRRR